MSFLYIVVKILDVVQERQLEFIWTAEYTTYYQCTSEVHTLILLFIIKLIMHV